MSPRSPHSPISSFHSPQHSPLPGNLDQDPPAADLDEGHHHEPPKPTFFSHLSTVPPSDHASIRSAVHAHSRPLASLPPPKKLPNPVKRALTNGFLAIAPTLHDAIDTWEMYRDPLPFINTTLDLLALPALILSPAMKRFPNSTAYVIDTPVGTPDVLPDPASLETLSRLPTRNTRASPTVIAPNAGPNIPASEARTITAAKRAFNTGKPSKAKNILKSNGVAPRCPAVTKVLRRMHVDRPEPLRLLPPVTTQIHITADACLEHLKRAAKSANDEPDVFGWSLGHLETTS